jgi:hypothetical protein
VKPFNFKTMETVTMTKEERQEYEVFKAEREKKVAAENRKKQRENYASMVDDEVAAAIPQLKEISEGIKAVKDTVFNNFEAILKMKQEVLGITRDDQRSHTFTNSDSTLRLTLGVNAIDGYRDTVEDGIAIVKEYIESLAKDDQTKTLVNTKPAISRPAACCNCARWPKTAATTASWKALRLSRRAISPP